MGTAMTTAATALPSPHNPASLSAIKAGGGVPALLSEQVEVMDNSCSLLPLQRINTAILTCFFQTPASSTCAHSAAWLHRWSPRMAYAPMHAVRTPHHSQKCAGGGADHPVERHVGRWNCWCDRFPPVLSSAHATSLLQRTPAPAPAYAALTQRTGIEKNDCLFLPGHVRAQQRRSRSQETLSPPPSNAGLFPSCHPSWPPRSEVQVLDVEERRGGGGPAGAGCPREQR